MNTLQDRAIARQKKAIGRLAGAAVGHPDGGAIGDLAARILAVAARMRPR